MSLADEFIDAIKDRERDIPGTTGQCTHRSNTYACNASVFDRMQSWEGEGGATIEYNLSLTIRVAVVTGTAIAYNDTIIHRSLRATVLHIREDPTGAFMRLLCVYEKGR
jgi:hypothetical protein